MPCKKVLLEFKKFIRDIKMNKHKSLQNENFWFKNSKIEGGFHHPIQFVLDKKEKVFSSFVQT